MPRDSAMSPPPLGGVATDPASKSFNASLTRYRTGSASSSLRMAAATVGGPRSEWIWYVPYRLTSPSANCTTATFAWSPSMMMKVGPCIWMFSNTRAPDWAIRVLMADKTDELHPPLTSLATVRPFESAMTDPRMPWIFWRKLSRIFSSCPSIPSSENVESSAFRRDSLRCIGLTSRRVNPGRLGPLGGSRLRTAADAEQRDSRRSHDEEQFVGAVPHGSQPHDEHHRSRHGRKGHADRRQDDENGQRDEPDRERAEEALDSLFHDEHPGPPDVPVHAGEGDERQSEETAEGREETDEAERDEGVCHARSDALILGGLLPANKHIVLNVPFWDLSLFESPKPPRPMNSARSQPPRLGAAGVPSRHGAVPCRESVAFVRQEKGGRQFGVKQASPKPASRPTASATPTSSLRPGRPASAERSSRAQAMATPPGGLHDEVVQIVRLERGQFVVRDPESAASPRDPPVPDRPKAIACGTSRRRRLGYLRHAVLDEAVHHEPSARIRPFGEPVIGQLV